MQGQLASYAVRVMTCAVAAAAMIAFGAPHAQPLIPDQSSRRGQVDEAIRREGEALLQIAEAAASGRALPDDFAITWRNDFFKAQPGTFVPFIVTFDAGSLPARAALLFIRVERIPPGSDKPLGSRPYAYETIFPVRIDAAPGRRASVSRGFAVSPGRYRVIVVLRESVHPADEGAERPRKTAALVRELDVPDFWTGELATSTVILADRLETLEESVPMAELDEDPYVVGTRRIHPAGSPFVPQNRELIVVFLIYNPTVDQDKHFDVQVDYHLYRKDPGGTSARAAGDAPPPGPGERYVTRTHPQRFNPSLMGRQFDPTGGAPVLAGQGILLSDVEPGEYRLLITVTDLLSRRAVARDVTFTVTGS